MSLVVLSPNLPPMLIPTAESGFRTINFGAVTANVPADVVVAIPAFVDRTGPIICGLADVPPAELYSLIAFVSDPVAGEVTFRATFSATGSPGDVFVHLFSYL
jgi:hypothetical protein